MQARTPQERQCRRRHARVLDDGVVSIAGALLLGERGGQLREADGLLAEVVVQLGQELLGQVPRVVFGPVDAPVVSHKLLLRHLLFDLHTGMTVSIPAFMLSATAGSGQAPQSPTLSSPDMCCRPDNRTLITSVSGAIQDCNSLLTLLNWLQQAASPHTGTDPRTGISPVTSVHKLLAQ